MSSSEKFPWVSEMMELRAWTVLLWRKPIPVIMALAITELLFFVIYELKLGSIASMIFLLILYSIMRLIRHWFDNPMEMRMFTDAEVELLDEVDEITKHANIFFAKIREQICFYVRHPTRNGNLIFYGSALLLLIALTVIGNFWCCYIVAHVILTVPGLYYCLIGRRRVLSMLETKEKME